MTSEATTTTTPIICECGLRAVIRTTLKDGPNKGRDFWCCPRGTANGGCKMFKWADEPSGDGQGRPPPPRASRPREESWQAASAPPPAKRGAHWDEVLGMEMVEVVDGETGNLVRVPTVRPPKDGLRDEAAFQRQLFEATSKSMTLVSELGVAIRRLNQVIDIIVKKGGIGRLN
jgi:hypothetical protein